MGLVERDKAVAGLEGLLTEAVAGRGRVAMISGTVGTGKSELLHTLADRAVDFGALAVTASGVPRRAQPAPRRAQPALPRRAPAGP